MKSEKWGGGNQSVSISFDLIGPSAWGREREREEGGDESTAMRVTVWRDKNYTATRYKNFQGEWGGGEGAQSPDPGLVWE